MPKLKTHKGAKKRFSFTATGKVKRGHSHARHIMTKKTTKRKRKLDDDSAGECFGNGQDSAYAPVCLIA